MIDIFAKTIIPGQQGTSRQLTTRVSPLPADSGQNNRAENSHQPTRQRERAMKRFTSAGHAQRFLSAFSVISPHFRARRHLLHAEEYRSEMANRFSTWNEVTGLTTAA
jgi:transposase-like protein